MLIVWCFWTVLIAALDINDCARFFVAFNPSSLTFNDETTGSNVFYDASGLTVSFETDGVNMFATLQIVGTILRTAASGPIGFLSGPSASSLNVDLTFTDNSPRRQGMIPLTVGSYNFQPDWQFYQVTSGLFSSSDSSILVAIQGQFENNMYQNLQIGSGAGTGNLAVYELAFSYTFRFPGDIIPRQGGLMTFSLNSACPCSRFANFRNYDNQSVNIFPPNVYSYLFAPRAFIRQQFSLTEMYSSGLDLGLDPVIYGINSVIDPPTHSSKILLLRGFARSIQADGQLWLYTLWFQGVPNNIPATGYARPVGTVQSDWQFFNLVTGTISFVTNNSGYTALQLNTSQLPSFGYPSGLTGPALQIGTGANTQNNDYGAFFAAMYIFNFGQAYLPLNITLAVNPCLTLLG